MEPPNEYVAIERAYRDYMRKMAKKSAPKRPFAMQPAYPSDEMLDADRCYDLDSDYIDEVGRHWEVRSGSGDSEHSG